jgi:Na+/H+-dicarboxylate symporter
MIDKNLWKYILVGMIAGSLVGLALSPTGGALIAPETALAIGAWLALPGVIFLGLIGMVILPLVITSIILGISASHDAGFVKRLGLRLVPYFMLTSLMAVLIGIGWAEIIQPGGNHDQTELSATQTISAPAANDAIENLTIPARIANLIPKNFLEAALNLDLLKIVIGSIIIGLVILSVPRTRVQTFLELCDTGQLLSMKIIGWAMVIAPFAVFGLLADALIKSGPATFIGLGGYVLTVLLGLLSVMVIYLLIVAVIARRSPLEFLRAIRDAQLLAFSTSSSSAVMPVSLQTAEERLHIQPDTARFVIPLGATINMDGTGLYQAAAAVFLCQLYGIDLSFVETLVLAFTMVGASIGTPATPGVGIIILSTIVAGLGVPPEGIGLILGVDRILDMCRTTINVTGDLTATTVMDRWMRGKV